MDKNITSFYQDEDDNLILMTQIGKKLKFYCDSPNVKWSSPGEGNLNFFKNQTNTSNRKVNMMYYRPNQATCSITPLFSGRNRLFVKTYITLK